MTVQTLSGQAVSHGIAIGRAVLTSSHGVQVRRYFIEPAWVQDEIARLYAARDAVVAELRRLGASIAPGTLPELRAVLEVHQMLLQDDELIAGATQWIAQRLYNSQWALSTQLEVLSRQFDAMQDEYLRERRTDVQQVVTRMLQHLGGHAASILPEGCCGKADAPDGDGRHTCEPLILVAHDLSPADMLLLRRSAFAGFITAMGGKTSHTAIVARSMAIPAVVGVRDAVRHIRQDDMLVIDGTTGSILVNPDPDTLRTCRQRQQAHALQRERLILLRHTPAVTQDGQRIELLANIEQPSDTAAAVQAGAVGVGLFRSEFLFMGRNGQLPDEEEQYRAYRAALDGMQGLPVTIRTIDIGADKPLEGRSSGKAGIIAGSVAGGSAASGAHSALGLRAIRWSLADPAMFRTQLRAILRAAAHGRVRLLFPMIGHVGEIDQIQQHLAAVRRELDERCVPYGNVQLGAMIEVPAAALTVRALLRQLDFISIGTNDLIQYTLAIDRADETVAHLYDPLHPAVLHLIADVITAARAAGKHVSVCGEMAGDTAMTWLLLGMGLRSFSMHPAQMPAVKQQILNADTASLTPWAQDMLQSSDPADLMAHPPALTGTGQTTPPLAR